MSLAGLLAHNSTITIRDFWEETTAIQAVRVEFGKKIHVSFDPRYKEAWHVFILSLSLHNNLLCWS